MFHKPHFFSTATLSVKNDTETKRVNWNKLWLFTQSKVRLKRIMKMKKCISAIPKKSSIIEMKLWSLWADESEINSWFPNHNELKSMKDKDYSRVNNGKMILPLLCIRYVVIVSSTNDLAQKNSESLPNTSPKGVLLVLGE